MMLKRKFKGAAGSDDGGDFASSGGLGNGVTAGKDYKEDTGTGRNSEPKPGQAKIMAPSS